VRLVLLWPLLLLPLGRAALAQGEIKPFPPVDPYTKNDPDAKRKAGYASFGPFRFGEDQTSEQVQQSLGGIPMIWVETDHFKLGSGLPEYEPRSDSEERERLRAELERLALRIPSLKPKTKKLDPWLRLHLYAQRLEELYAQFLQEFGLEEGDFPTAPPDPKQAAGTYMGEGRYLGMSSKYLVLVLDKKSALARYGNVHLSRNLQGSTRWYLPVTDAWLFVTAAECLEGDYANDSGLACDVVSGVSQNLAMGFRGYRVPLAFAVTEGLAHWFARQVDPRYHIFSGLDRTKVRVKDEWNWAPSVRARVEHKVFPAMADVLAWTDAEALEWSDHLMLWSRMDFLLARTDGAAGALLRRLKEPAGTPSGQLTPEELLERTKTAFAQVAGGDLARFDEAWSEWVLKTYPKK
jgi:hypothetical protein